MPDKARKSLIWISSRGSEGLVSPFKRLMNVFDKTIKVVIVALFTVMTIVVMAQVISRYVLPYSLSWSEELARYLMIWITFLASGIGFKVGAHIGVSIIREKVGGKWGVVLSLGLKLAVLVFLAIVTRYGVSLVAAIKTQLSPALEIPMSIPYAAVPVGCTIMMLYLIEMGVDDLRTLARKEI